MKGDIMAHHGPGRPSASYPEAMRSIPVTDWPHADRGAWERACSRAGPLDPAGAAVRWQPTTRHAAEQDWGNFLNALRLWGELDPEADPGSRMTQDRLGRYIRLRRETAKPNTVKHNIIRLSQILNAMCPDQDWRWVRRHPDRPGTGEIRAAQKRHDPPDLDVVFDACLSIMADIDQRPPSIANAIRFRDAVMGALLCTIPMRRKNLVDLTIGRSVLVDEWAVHIRFDGRDTKNGRPIAGMLPPSVDRQLRRYLEHHRLLLLRDHVSDRLWIELSGGPLDYYGVGRIMRDLGTRVLGRPLTTHMFRHAVATYTMTRDPRDKPLAAESLSHNNLSTVETFYDRSGRKPSQQAWEDILREERRRAREELEWRER